MGACAGKPKTDDDKPAASAPEENKEEDSPKAQGGFEVCV